MPSADPRPSQLLGDRPALDGIRALAVLLVIGFHTHVPLLAGGALGVTVFFSLSGFLITTLLLEELDARGGLDIPRFLGRRVLRLFPALVLLGVGVVLLHPLGIGAGTDALGLGSALTWSSNWVRALSRHRLGMVGHTWSLAVEAQFYLVWPYLLLIAHRIRGVQGVRVLAVGLALGSLVLRLLLWSGPDSVDRFYGTDTTADQLLWGCALATFAPHHRTVGRRLRSLGPSLPLIAVLGIGAVFATAATHAMVTVGYALLSLLSAVLVAVAVVEVPGTRWLGKGLVRWLGQLSYGIYLWHYPVIFCLRGWFHTERHPWLEFVSCTVLTTAVAWVSYTLVEAPLRRSLRPWVEVPRVAGAQVGHSSPRAPR